MSKNNIDEFIELKKKEEILKDKMEDEIREIFYKHRSEAFFSVEFWINKIYIHLTEKKHINTHIFYELNKYFGYDGKLYYNDGDYSITYELRC